MIFLKIGIIWIVSSILFASFWSGNFHFRVKSVNGIKIVFEWKKIIAYVVIYALIIFWTLKLE